MLPFYHPTTTLLLDDDGSFLESFRYRYCRSMRCEALTSPERALALLVADDSRFNRLTRASSPPAFELSGIEHEQGEAVVTIDLSWVDRLAEDPARFQAISVAIVDFAMPSMDGVEFCRRIKSHSCCKLLLTGKAGDHTAVQAFNEGLIDTFLVKQDAKLSERLPLELRKLSERYFSRLSASLAPLTVRGPGRFLSDAVFSETLQKHALWEGVSEYYLMLDPPGFRIVRGTGSATRLLVYDFDMMRAQLETAIAEEAPQGLVEQIERRKSLLHFPTPGGFYTREYASHWTAYTSPAVRIDGQEPWWVAEAPLYTMNGRPSVSSRNDDPRINQ